jgi:TRAP-type C4-dicarboxylate transport system substrate-binding protein
MLRTTLAFLLMTLATQAPAQEATTLRFANTGAANAATWTEWWDPWTKRVEQDSGGTLKFQVYFSGALGNLMNVYDRITAGVADLGLGVVSPLRGKLAGTFVMELPSDFNGEEGSAGMWHIFESGLTANEWRENKPLALFVYPQNSMHFVAPVTKVEELRGLKLATVSKIDADILTRMGAAPVTVTPTELYEVVNRRVASAAVIGWTGVMAFKLFEVTNYHLNAPLGSGGGFLNMNKDAYAKLPEKARAALDKNSGYTESKNFGAALDRIYLSEENLVRQMPRQTIGVLPREEHARWAAFGAPITDEWVKTTPNGPTILAAFREVAMKVRREKGR